MNSHRPTFRYAAECLLLLFLLGSGCTSAPPPLPPAPSADTRAEEILPQIATSPQSVGALDTWSSPDAIFQLRDLAGDGRISRDGFARRPAADAAPPLPTVKATNKVKLYFATSRKPHAPPQQRPWFTGAVNSHSDPLSYGSCIVSIPPNHQTNRVEKITLHEKYILDIDPLDTNHFVVVHQPQITNRDSFHANITEEIRRRDQKSLLVFVHGFNNTFDDAASRLAVLVYDMDYNGVPVLFSWPSAGGRQEFGGLDGVLAYRGDEKRAASANAEFPRFLAAITQVARNAGARRVNILAHSMGNRVVIEGLKMLAKEGHSNLVNELVMAAPDVRTSDLDAGSWQSIRRLTGRTTLYASRRDWALYTSRLLDKPRLGQVPNPPENLYVAEGMDTVDASDIDFTKLGLNHTYFGGPTIIRDVTKVLEHSMPPAHQDRRLIEKARIGQFPVWTFPTLRVR